MRVVYTLKKLSAILLISLLVTILAVPAVTWARTEARYELISGNAIFGNDLGQVNSKQSLFHQQTLTAADNESMSISFPVSIGGIVAGPVQAGAGSAVGGVSSGAGATANVLPFGLVDLAFPSIDETIDQSYSASSTGFYTATFLGIPPINYGGAPVTSGIYASDTPVSTPASLIGSNMMFPEMSNIIPGYDQSKAASNSTMNQSKNVQANRSSSAGNVVQNNTSEIKAPALLNETSAGQGIVGNGSSALNNTIFNAQLNNQAGANQTHGEHETISGQELVGAETSVPLNYTGRNVTDQNLSYPYFNFKAKAGKISNMSLLDRMWRNSHLGTMGRAYEGDTSHPDWILPTEYTKSAIAMYNWSDVNGIALNQTKPGTHLMPRFWGLGIASPYNMGNVTIGPQKSVMNMKFGQH